MVNPYKGEAVVELDGKPYALRYDWQGFALLREQLGESFEIETAQALAKFDLEFVAKVLAVGLRESAPGITWQEIMAKAPPIGPVSEAISLAFRRTWWGKEGKPPEPKQNPLMRLLRTIGRKTQFSAG
jgi:hypothetical protein